MNGALELYETVCCRINVSPVLNAESTRDMVRDETLLFYNGNYQSGTSYDKISQKALNSCVEREHRVRAFLL